MLLFPSVPTRLSKVCVLPGILFWDATANVAVGKGNEVTPYCTGCGIGRWGRMGEKIKREYSNCNTVPNAFALSCDFPLDDPSEICAPVVISSTAVCFLQERPSIQCTVCSNYLSSGILRSWAQKSTAEELVGERVLQCNQCAGCS